MSATSVRISSANRANSPTRICCGPSQSASSGCGCTSTITPSAPTATAARASGSTRSLRPAACDGSTSTGRCVSRFSTGTAERSSVYRVERSNVLMPRSHRITRSFPSFATYSAAMRSSSTVADGARLSNTGFGTRPTSARRLKLCMLRAPIWMTSAISATSATSRGSRSSVTIGSPVSSRASARISRPFEPRPWNAYGDERGLNAPPRSTVAPAAATARAVSSVCSRVSTVHGPAISPKKPSPIRRPRTSMTVESGVRPARDEGIRDELLRSGCVHRGECSAGDDAGRQVQGQSRDAHLLRDPADGREAPRQLRGRLPPVRRRRRSRARRSSASSTCTRSASSTTPRSCASATLDVFADAHRDRPRSRALDDLRAEPRHRARGGELAAVVGDELRRAPTDDAVQGEVASRRTSSRPALFTYPVLQAGDILLYQTDVVPVGDRPAPAHRAHARRRRALQLPLRRDVHAPARRLSRDRRADHGSPGAREEDVDDGRHRATARSTSSTTADEIRRKFKVAVTDSGREVRHADDKPGISNLIEIMTVATGESIAEVEAAMTARATGRSRRTSPKPSSRSSSRSSARFQRAPRRRERAPSPPRARRREGSRGFAPDARVDVRAHGLRADLR